MTKTEKVCRTCRIFVKGDKCTVCGGTDFGSTWAGIAIIMDPSKSEVSKKMGVELPGKYALKVR
jgi:DNA-directed RNA polymerase subunit E"